ncbi:MAG TPA: fumarylacetoacetase [Saprospiraceae bacterium]|nr:fumarylacetoacetase [Saprospiraceae bacterium]
MNTWMDIPSGSDFSIYNIPFGIYSKNGEKRIGSRIGDMVIDLESCVKLNIFPGVELPDRIWRTGYLNEFIELGKATTRAVRSKIQEALCDENSMLKKASHVFIPISEVEMHLPVRIGDYTDFYSSIEHATNVGKMFRDPENALLPNWRHLPVGYHGRSSSIVVSGTDIRRPFGQLKPQDGPPVYAATKRLDFELEMAFIIGKENKLGDPIAIKDTDEYLFGMVVFNDWSARDIQKWEYVPLGPFLAKNFASSISPWIVTMEALQDFSVSGPKQEPEVLDYLKFEGDKNYDIKLEVGLTPDGGTENVICRSNFKYMYWNMNQQLAHHTVNGCNVRVGDMMASGTISGPSEDSFGSMLELSWSGSNPINLANGESRTFIEDGDTITMRAYCEKGDKRIGFGEVSGKVIV